MSISSWMREFYPIAASQTIEEDAVGHCLRKWRGIREAELSKHHLQLWDAGSVLVDALHNCFSINGATCALCYHYDNDCSKCPLTIAGFECNPNEDNNASPWQVWHIAQDPEPMIAALEALHGAT